MASLEVLLRIGIYVMALVVLTFLFWYIIQVLWIKAKRRAVKAALFILSIVLAISTLFGTLTFYVYNGIGHQPDIYRSGNRSSNMVALTFDDGPSPEFTPAILDILREYNVPATFFMVGAHVEKYPEIAQRIVEEGHEIGNHTYNHRNIPTLSTMDLNKELLEATAAITGITESTLPMSGLPGHVWRQVQALGQRFGPRNRAVDCIHPRLALRRLRRQDCKHHQKQGQRWRHYPVP